MWQSTETVEKIEKLKHFTFCVSSPAATGRWWFLFSVKLQHLNRKWILNKKNAQNTRMCQTFRSVNTQWGTLKHHSLFSLGRAFLIFFINKNICVSVPVFQLPPFPRFSKTNCPDQEIQTTDDEITTIPQITQSYRELKNAAEIT